MLVCCYSYRGGVPILAKSRAEYFKERRKTISQFNISLPKEKLKQLEEKLEEKKQTKTAWLTEKIDDELKK